MSGSSEGRDWLQMTRADFDVAVEETLFDLEPEPSAADDGYGTGDLLAEIPAETHGKKDLPTAQDRP
jgi:hypothetical protein